MHFYKISSVNVRFKINWYQNVGNMTGGVNEGMLELTWPGFEGLLWPLDSQSEDISREAEQLRDRQTYRDTDRSGFTPSQTQITDFTVQPSALASLWSLYSPVKPGHPSDQRASPHPPASLLIHTVNTASAFNHYSICTLFLTNKFNPCPPWLPIPQWYLVSGKPFLTANYIACLNRTELSAIQ